MVAVAAAVQLLSQEDVCCSEMWQVWEMVRPSIWYPAPLLLQQQLLQQQRLDRPRLRRLQQRQRHRHWEGLLPMTTMLPATPFCRPSWEERVEAGVVRPPDRAVPPFSLHCWDLVWVVLVAAVVPVERPREQGPQRPILVPLARLLLLLPPLPALRICWVLKSVNS